MNAKDRIVLKQGMLKKRAVSAKMVRPWRSRRIVLRRDVIEWYKPGQAEGMQGSLLLTSGTTLQPKGGRSNSFAVCTDEETLALSAPTSAERDEWYDAVQGVVQRLRNDDPEAALAVPRGRPSLIHNQESDDDDYEDDESTVDESSSKLSERRTDTDSSDGRPAIKTSAQLFTRQVTQPLMVDAPDLDGGTQGLGWCESDLDEDEDGDVAHAFIERQSGLRRDSVPQKPQASSARLPAVPQESLEALSMADEPEHAGSGAPAR